MTELLELTPQSRVLEIGTGSGYQTAILAHLVHHVCSVERIKGLQWQARRRLKQLDLHNVSTRHGDGWQGWQARAPFDAIIVTAAPPEIPTALMTQLDEGGILVLPVGEEHQYLKRVRRRGRRIYYRYRGGRALCPFGEGGAGLKREEIPGFFQVILPQVSVWWTSFPVFSMVPCTVIMSLVVNQFSWGINERGKPKIHRSPYCGFVTGFALAGRLF